MSERGPRPSRGISPHCAASVAAAPAIITIEIYFSDPCGARCSRSMTKKPMQAKRCRLGMPGNDPGDDPAADAMVVPADSMRPGAGGRDDAGTGRRAGERGIAHRRAVPARRPCRGFKSLGRPNRIATNTTMAIAAKTNSGPGEPEQREHEQGRQRRADDRPQAEAAGEGRKRLDPRRPSRARCEIGLRRAGRCRAERPVKRAADGEGAEGQPARERAVQPASSTRPHSSIDAMNPPTPSRVSALRP